MIKTTLTAFTAAFLLSCATGVAAQPVSMNENKTVSRSAVDSAKAEKTVTELIETKNAAALYRGVLNDPFDGFGNLNIGDLNLDENIDGTDFLYWQRGIGPAVLVQLPALNPGDHAFCISETNPGNPSGIITTERIRPEGAETYRFDKQAENIIISFNEQIMPAVGKEDIDSYRQLLTQMTHVVMNAVSYNNPTPAQAAALNAILNRLNEEIAETNPPVTAVLLKTAPEMASSHYVDQRFLREKKKPEWEFPVKKKPER